MDLTAPDVPGIPPDDNSPPDGTTLIGARMSSVTTWAGPFTQGNRGRPEEVPSGDRR